MFDFSIVLARECLSAPDFKYVQTYFSINSFMAHPESILLAMLFDKSPEVRKKAVDVIIQVKKKKSTAKLPRQFFRPKLNFEAEKAGLFLFSGDLGLSPSLLPLPEWMVRHIFKDPLPPSIPIIYVYRRQILELPFEELWPRTSDFFQLPKF